MAQFGTDRKDKKKEDLVMKSIKIALCSFVSMCISIAVAGWYGWRFRADVVSELPGIPNFADYVVEGVRAYIIMTFVLLFGAIVFSVRHEKEKISFYVRWGILDLVIAVVGLLVLFEIFAGIY